MMEKYKILLDTDIGDDIDDALALALALEMPEMELVGVTTVFQNTETVLVGLMDIYRFQLNRKACFAPQSGSGLDK